MPSNPPSFKQMVEDERRVLERRLLQAQKLESLGVLSGRVAHEFNNLLTSILGYAELALADLPPASPVADSVRAITASAIRAAEISQQLVSFSRCGRPMGGGAALSAVVRETQRLLQLAASKRNRLQLELADAVSIVAADEDQLKQIVLLLVVNAAESVGNGGGTVVVSTSEVTCDAGHAVIDHAGTPLVHGSYAVLSVSDDGAAMSRDVLAQALGPRFTPTAADRGLVLRAALETVRGLGGAAQVESRPGRGTTIRVFLPVAQPAPPRSDAPADGPV